MSDAYLGRDPDIFTTCSPALRKQVIEKVLENFSSGASYESCCWAAEIPPEIFSAWRQADKRLEKACRQKLAELEIEYVRVMRGLPPKNMTEEQRALWKGYSASDQKMAHEALKVLSKYWAPRQQGAQLQAGLEELSKTLPVEAYALVVNTLYKHIDA
jgi:hypothetical protein